MSSVNHEGLDEALAATEPAGAPRTRLLGRGQAVGRYVVLECLGAGGMGVVYTAYDPELDRKIALKLLRTDQEEGGQRARARLLREAQAMARLSHPNVITVHDVGTYDNEVFVAMEFVGGGTLTGWLKEKRSVAEILTVFVGAGRGLQAAHAADLVHRDFKPDNVLLGKDGRVFVCDFGLACPTSMSGEDPTPAPATWPRDEQVAEFSKVRRTIVSRLTQGGRVMGTPGYMAPEQYMALSMDARTDQFAYCVGLYEALYGELPYAGDDYEAVATEVINGNVRPPPKDSRVPPWLRRILLRGLAVEPKDRYPSMDALLQDLSRDPRAARRRALGIGAACLVLVAVGAYGYHAQRQRALICSGADKKLAGVWDGARKGAIQQAFAATGKPYAKDAWAGTEEAIDRYLGSWVRMHTESCKATRERHEQSEEIFDLRMQCLGDRLSEVDALASVFSHADATVVEKAVQAAHSLTGLELCANLAGLRAQVRPPEDPAKRARVEALGVRLNEGKALKHAGKFADGLRLAGEVLREARTLNYRPIEAEALYFLGDMQGEAGDFRAAEETLYEAVWAAEAARHDKVAARASARLVSVVGNNRARYAEGHLWGRHAEAELLRIGGDELLEAKLLNSLGTLCISEGRDDEALAHLQRATDLRVRLNGPEHPIVAESVYNLGRALRPLGRYDEARAHYERALAIWQKALGPEHPSVARSLDQLGRMLAELGRNDEAGPYYERALAIRKKALPPDHPDLGQSYLHLGQLAELRRDFAPAQEYFQNALAVFQKAEGPRHPDVAFALFGLGMARLAQQERAEGLADLGQAIRICDTVRCDFDKLAEARAALEAAAQHQGKHRRGGRQHAQLTRR